MSIKEPEFHSEAIVVRERSSVVLTPVMDVNTAMKRLEEFQTFCANYLQESKDGGQDGGDHGIIPGTKKKTLFKSGADKLCEVYGLYDEYVFDTKLEDWDRGLFDYGLKCILKSRRDDSMVGSGLGSCSSYESKYRWRDEQKKCPNCGSASIIKGKDFKGDGLPTGWLCFAKKGGCGTKFKDGDKSIEGQVTGRVQNEDIADIKNTVLKIAKKRAKIDAVIGVTRSSGIFTQDMEDFPMPPAKPEVPRTTEPEEIGGKSQPVAASTQEGAATEAPKVSMADHVQKGASEMPALRQTQESAVEKHPIVGADCIGKGEAVNFAREFNAALPKKYAKDAEDIRHSWLAAQGIKDAIGKASAYAIKKDCFYDVREAAVQYAKEYQG